MEQSIFTNGRKIITTRCPVRINGQKLVAAVPAPQVGEHNEKILKEFVSALK
jgi:CoA:oxalate CoA-transferase